ncbi:hypothetical protein REPUB_Repub05bG0087700 [Reevesia pubescens]
MAQNRKKKESISPLVLKGLFYVNQVPTNSRGFANVTCQALDEIGLEKTLQFAAYQLMQRVASLQHCLLSLSVLDKSLKLKDCKAFFQKSPLETCNVPTDVNKKITGAPFSAYHVFKEKHTKFYFVGPFYYTFEAKPVPNGY